MYFSTSDLYHKSDLTPDNAWSAKTKKLEVRMEPDMTGGKIKVNIMMLNDIMLYSQIDEYHNCHQRAFIQELLETDLKTLSQALGSAWGILLLKRGRRDYRNHRGPGHHKGTHRNNYYGITEAYSVLTDN